MKRSNRLIITIFAMAYVIGCSEIKPDQDRILVSAERSTALAADTIDAFLTLDNLHRELLREKAPQVHALAERLRKRNADGTAAIGSAEYVLEKARRFTKTYKEFRTKENAEAAVRAITEAEETARESRLAIISAKSVVGD